jgi:hypothetical protein
LKKLSESLCKNWVDVAQMMSVLPGVVRQWPWGTMPTPGAGGGSISQASKLKAPRKSTKIVEHTNTRLSYPDLNSFFLIVSEAGDPELKSEKLLHSHPRSSYM